MPNILDSISGYEQAQADVFNRDDSLVRANLTGDEGMLSNDGTFNEGVVQGSLEASLLKPGADMVTNLWKTDEEKRARNLAVETERANRDTLGGFVGEAASLAHPMYQAGRFGRGLMAETFVGTKKISNSVARRQAGKGNTFTQNIGARYDQLKNTRFDSNLKNYGAEVGAEALAGIGYDYGRHLQDQASYDKEGDFNLGESALWNVGLGSLFAGGSVLSNVAKGTRTAKGNVADLKKETAKTGGFAKANPNTINEMKKTGRLKENGDNWTYMAEDGLGIHGTKVGDNYYMDTKRSTFDDETIASKFSEKMSDEDVSTFNSYKKATKGEGKKYGDQTDNDVDASGDSDYMEGTDSYSGEAYSTTKDTDPSVQRGEFFTKNFKVDDSDVITRVQEKYDVWSENYKGNKPFDEAKAERQAIAEQKKEFGQQYDLAVAKEKRALRKTFPNKSVAKSKTSFISFLSGKIQWIAGYLSSV